MNIGALLQFAPLIIGLVWVGYLLFKKDLPSASLGSILTYFIGVLIVFIAVGWLIDRFVIDWSNDRLQNARQSQELEQLIRTSEDILNETLNDGETNPVFVDGPTNNNQSVNGSNNNSGSNSGTTGNGGTSAFGPEGASGTKRHVVMSGETLFSIARRYGTTVNAIMNANGLASETIYAGDTLIIPAP